MPRRRCFDHDRYGLSGSDRFSCRQKFDHQRIGGLASSISGGDVDGVRDLLAFAFNQHPPLAGLLKRNGERATGSCLIWIGGVICNHRGAILRVFVPNGFGPAPVVSNQAADPVTLDTLKGDARLSGQSILVLGIEGDPIKFDR